MPEWFDDAKFGIFIHWGVYSVPAWIRVTEGRYASYAEWYYARVMGELKGEEDFHERTFGEDFEYRDFAPMFTAELFDPDLWASLFAESGARYVVLTSKHHDGFCLWPTKSPFKEELEQHGRGAEAGPGGGPHRGGPSPRPSHGALLLHDRVGNEPDRPHPKRTLHPPGGHGPIRDPHRSVCR